MLSHYLHTHNTHEAARNFVTDNNRKDKGAGNCKNLSDEDTVLMENAKMIMENTIKMLGNQHELKETDKFSEESDVKKKIVV